MAGTEKNIDGIRKHIRTLVRLRSGKEEALGAFAWTQAIFAVGLLFPQTLEPGPGEEDVFRGAKTLLEYGGLAIKNGDIKLIEKEGSYKILIANDDSMDNTPGYEEICWLRDELEKGLDGKAVLGLTGMMAREQKAKALTEAKLLEIAISDNNPSIPKVRVILEYLGELDHLLKRADLWMPAKRLMEKEVPQLGKIEEIVRKL
jgi:hypothetical protein